MFQVLALHLHTKSFLRIVLRLPYAPPSLLLGSCLGTWLAGHRTWSARERCFDCFEGQPLLARFPPRVALTRSSRVKLKCFGDSNSSIAESNRSMKSTAAVGVT